MSGKAQDFRVVEVRIDDVTVTAPGVATISTDLCVRILAEWTQLALDRQDARWAGDSPSGRSGGGAKATTPPDAPSDGRAS